LVREDKEHYVSALFAIRKGTFYAFGNRLILTLLSHGGLRLEQSFVASPIDLIAVMELII
jgi:hypothetical protein